MKKAVFVSFLLLVTVGIVGCGRANRIYVRETTRGNVVNDYPTDDTRFNDYNNALAEIDTRLYNDLDALDGGYFDEGDAAYLTDKRDYYIKTSNAYKRALDDVNNLDITDDYREYYGDVVSYYQNGYDTYNGLYVKYRDFNSIDEERAYRNEIGDAGYRISQDVEDRYNKRVNDLNFRGNL